MSVSNDNILRNIISSSVSRDNSYRTSKVAAINTGTFSTFVDNATVNSTSATYSGTGLGSTLSITGLTIGKGYLITSIVRISKTNTSDGGGVRILDITGAPVILKAHTVRISGGTTVELENSFTDMWTVTALATQIDLKVDLFEQSGTGTITKNAWTVIVYLQKNHILQLLSKNKFT